MINENGKMVLKTTDYSHVSLLESKFKKQFDDVKEYFLALPNDDILYGFRKRAGLPHPGNELGGWYSNDASYNMHEWNEIFNAFGQWLSFFGRAYQVTGDERLREKGKSLMEEWGKTIDENGYFFYSDDCNAWHYSYEKIESGLTDLLVYGKIPEAETYLEKITDWAEENLPRFRNPANDGFKASTGGEPSIKIIDNEWYTLSEGLYRAYVATGNEKFKKFAEVWHYDYYWDALRDKKPGVLTGVHGYSHVNNLGGAAMAYRVSGDKKYLDTIVNGYDVLKEYQWMASGGYAFGERMASPDGSNYEAVETVGESFEVPCGSWAIFKIVRHLTSLTGTAKYGEWAETALYNAIGAAMPMKDDCMRRGKTFYYADYRIGGGRNVYYDCSFPCCSGTYPQALTEYFNMIYYYDDNGVYVSQYIPSIYDNNGIKIEVSGNFPEEDHFTVKTLSTGHFKLSLRIPSWVSPLESSIKINGSALTDAIVPNEWFTIEKDWNTGDTIEVVFPMHLSTFPISKDHPERAAILYGPIMLASVGRHFTVGEDYKDLKEMESTKDGLTFKTRCSKGNPLEFKPFWTFGEREWYTVYHDFISK